MQTSSGDSGLNEIDTGLALSALAIQPTVEAASYHLETAHSLRLTPQRLERLRQASLAEYNALCLKTTNDREKGLSEALMDNAAMAAHVVGLCIQRTQHRLQEGKIDDPSRTARDLSDVVAKSVDKKLAMEGRPTRITETRSVSDIVRALEGKNILKKIEVIQGGGEE